MGNGEGGRGKGEGGMRNGEWWSAVIPKIKLESAQHGKETRIARGKRTMEGKNIYLSVFPEFLELFSFC